MPHKNITKVLLSMVSGVRFRVSANRRRRVACDKPIGRELRADGSAESKTDDK